MVYTNENWKPPITYCEPNKVEVQRMNKQEVITLLEKLRTFHNGTYAKSIDTAIEALQAEPKTGKWIDVENEPYCECSVCGAYIDNLDDDYAFCPRCGADMRGEME